MDKLPLKISIVTAFALFALAGCNGDDDNGGDVAGVDTVFSNGTILTVNADNDVAEAVAVDDGEIVAVGSTSDVEDLAGDETREVDLQGQTMIPGIYDAHSHFSFTGTAALYSVNLNSPPIGDVETIDELIAKLSERAESTPEGEWIEGFGYDDTLLAENRHPTREDLDQVSTEHPIFITHTSGHLAVANSLALEKAGITAETPQPEGGVIRKDESGEPTGVLEEPPASGMVSSLIPPTSTAVL